MSIVQKFNRERIFLKKAGVVSYATKRAPKLLLERLIAKSRGPDRKHEALKNFQERFALETLVETGTYLGEMIHAMRNRFKKIYSVELDPELYKNAKKRFANARHIAIYEGDSGEILPQILPEIREPALFWLDAHYSNGITARGIIDTPIAKELDAVFNHPVKHHVILIDDARCFNGTAGYPTIAQLENFTRTNYPNHKIEVKKDIIRIYPIL